MAGKSPKPVDVYVGSRVRMRRTELGMSQEKLGDAIGITFQQVQKYEKGTNRTGSSRLHQVAGILGVPVTFFFEGAPGQRKTKGKAISSDYVTQFLATPDGLALAKAFTQIKDRKLRRGIAGMVITIADAGL